MATLTPSPPLGQSWLPPQCGHVFYQIRLTSGRDRVENDSWILWHGYNGLHFFGWSILTIRSQKVKIPWNRVCTAAGSHATTCSSLKRNTHWLQLHYRIQATTGCSRLYLPRVWDYRVRSGDPALMHYKHIFHWLNSVALFHWRDTGEIILYSFEPIGIQNTIMFNYLTRYIVRILKMQNLN